MKTAQAFASMLDVIDAQIDTLKADCASVQRAKAQLMQHETHLVEQEHALQEMFDDALNFDASAYRLHEMRLRRLKQLRWDLGPRLARATTDVQARKDALKAAMRSRKALEVQLDVLQRNARHSDEDAVQATLYGYRMRFQRTS